MLIYFQSLLKHRFRLFANKLVFYISSITSLLFYFLKLKYFFYIKINKYYYIFNEIFPNFNNFDFIYSNFGLEVQTDYKVHYPNFCLFFRRFQEFFNITKNQKNIIRFVYIYIYKSPQLNFRMNFEINFKEKIFNLFFQLFLQWKQKKIFYYWIQNRCNLALSSIKIKIYYDLFEIIC